ncbi:MAG: nicotinate-nicotinamide nucleotide adenylyltransferase [Fibrobacterales bacterium]|nr:nicotinate-nicotinamide nucleotide adenylyltransferase [Fibrobacterales bacterium]
MRRKKRVAVLGGAFDPVHVDHVRLARECLEWNMADEVRFVVAPDVRWDKRTVAGAEDRLEMVRLATEGMENVVVSREEIDAGEYRGSLRMLERLVRNDPGNEYALAVGSDSYPRIPSWRDQTEGWKPNGEELLRRFSLMVWPRPGAEMPDPVAHREKGYAPLILPPQKAWTTASPVSSTRVRELLGRGESADALLPPAVAAYIARKGLYRTSSR